MTIRLIIYFARYNVSFTPSEFGTEKSELIFTAPFRDGVNRMNPSLTPIRNLRFR